MKVLLLNYEYPPLGGGAANATYYMLKEFASLGVEVDAVVSSHHKAEVSMPFKGIRIYRLDIGKNEELHNQSYGDLLKYSLRAYKKIKKLIADGNYDLIHAFFGIPCGFLAMATKMPYIVSLRGSDVPFYSAKYYWLDRLFFKALSKRIWRKAQYTVANSEGLAMLAKGVSPNQEIEVIPNGVDTHFFHPPQSQRSYEKLIFLFTGRLIVRKGILELVEAFLQFNISREHELLIVGEGPLKSELQRKVKAAKQADHVRFLGIIGHQHISDIYREANVFVMPSRNEGMSNSLLEAMATGLPIVTTNTGGSKELLRNNGILISSVDVPSIFAALSTVALDRVGLEEMGRNSRNLAERLSWRRVAQGYVELYKKKTRSSAGPMKPRTLS